MLTNQVNSTGKLFDSSENVAQANTYTPYGELASHTNYVTGLTNSLTYTGREDDSNNLLYYRNRYYSSTMKRFISEDPIGLKGGINQYAYVDGNPLSFINPIGLCDVDIQGKNKGGGYCHLTIITTDPIVIPYRATTPRYFRGGPTYDPKDYNNFFFNMYGYGPILAGTGTYTKDSTDYQESPYASFNISHASSSCDSINQAFSNITAEINGAAVPYTPFGGGYNSNSVVYTYLLNAGLPTGPSGQFVVSDFLNVGIPITEIPINSPLYGKDVLHR